MKIGVVGTGYVGLVTGTCLADFGHFVTCFDKDVSKLSDLKLGKIPIYEPGLEELLEKNLKANRLHFALDIMMFLKDLDVIFVAIGTPQKEDSGEADIEEIFNFILDLKKKMSGDHAIVIKSTVPVGTNQEIYALMNNKAKQPIDIISNPEFLREGSAIEDFMRPDRVIVGARTERSFAVMTEVYKPLYLREYPMVYTDPESAEMIKYAANAFLATKVSFINEVAFLCEKVGADVKEVAKGIGLDGRIGKKFLHVGPGFGGSCFPKDLLALTKIGRKFEAPQRIIEEVIKTNHQVKLRMIDKIKDILDRQLLGMQICVFGITFKPNTDDVRDAPSLTIIPELLKHDAIVNVCDPKGEEKGSKLLTGVNWFADPFDAAENSDLIVILTEWNEFRALALSDLAKKMRVPRMLDLRNIYSKKEVLGSGFKSYVSIGRN